jgi:hypothetical protein
MFKSKASAGGVYTIQCIGPGSGTTVYTTSGETSGTGYTAGGKTLTGVTVLTSGTIAYVD